MQESIHSLSFGSSALKNRSDNYSIDSINSLDYYSDNPDLGSYLENRSHNAFPIYTRSKERRASDTSYLSWKEVDQSDSLPQCPNQLTNGNKEALPTIEEDFQGKINRKRLWKEGFKSFDEEEEEESLPFLASNSDTDDDQNSSLSLHEKNYNSKKRKKNLKLYIPEKLYEDNSLTKEKENVISPTSLKKINSLENLLDVPVSSLIVL